MKKFVMKVVSLYCCPVPRFSGLELVVAKDINWNLDSSVSLPVAYVLLLHQELIMFLISV